LRCVGFNIDTHAFEQGIERLIIDRDLFGNDMDDDEGIVRFGRFRLRISWNCGRRAGRE
jgi:hypothetical protein